MTIQQLTVRDIRFPTSRTLAGSDAMNPDPDYSAAYVTLGASTPGAPQGHGLAFTIGRGTELCVAAIQAFRPFVLGTSLERITADMAGFWRSLTRDSQLRWLGPEKGVIHLATAAIVNAVWDLWAKHERKPLWQLLADLTPDQLAGCIDFSYLTDALTPREAVAWLRAQAPQRDARRAHLLAHGYPAYTTSAGWLGYSDAKLRGECAAALAEGWDHFKLKVGVNPADDHRRASILRDVIGPHRRLMLDANQVWDVPEAITALRPLAQFNPWWIEEPTSPDDVLGHAAIARAIAPMGVATGEHCQNRVLFKQFMQAGAMQFCQIDVCRLGGINEALAVLLLAAKFRIPVCPHAGGVGLCEQVQHLSAFDYLSVSGALEDRVLEYVDHLHEHFVHPVVIERGCYRLPTAPGLNTEMKPESLEQYAYPHGRAWK